MLFNLNSNFRITNDGLFRHINICLFVINIFFSTISFAQEIDQPLTLTNQDIADTINCLKTDNPNKSVQLFKQKFPLINVNEKLRQEVMVSQPTIIYKLRLTNSHLEAKVREFIKPILSLYDRESYQLFVIDHKMPYVVLDSGVLLIISTGVFQTAESDDEILGYVAHEIGHEYFLTYSSYTKHLFSLVKDGGREPALSRKFADVLALLELQADAFSAITLAHLGYEPTAFIAGMERNNLTYPPDPKTFHPPNLLRRQVVENVVPKESVQSNQRRKTALFLEIKTLTTTSKTATLKDAK